MNFLAARAGVDSSRLGSYSPFYAGHQLSGSMYAYGSQLGADEPLTKPEDSFVVDPAAMQPLESGAETWGADEWAYMAKWAAEQERITGFKSVAWDAIREVAGMPDIWGNYYQIAIRLGGAWMGDFVPSTTGTVTLEPGEIQTPEGITTVPVVAEPVMTEPVTGGFDPATATPTPTPTTTSDMFSKPNGAAAPVVSSTQLDTVDVTRTGTPVNVKGQPKNIDWNTALVVPTDAPAAIDEGEIPAPTTAGFGGGMLGMLALGGLALAVLASKRKR